MPPIDLSSVLDQVSSFAQQSSKAGQELFDLSAQQAVSNSNDAVLQKQIDELKQMITGKSVQPSVPANRNNEQVTVSSSLGAEVSSLQQNTPNPFNQNTVIKYFIPQQANSAVIKITSANGQEIKSIILAQKGNGQINTEAGSLAAGTYQYTLIVDGKIADSRKMVVLH